ncbi:glycoside hydrolase family 3 protein, partial [Nonomuraea maheshkhaliensis]|uniref:glycoside hydrolase family 3 protein n=1 Tax=Nonomuraea maheshkhaliensis TaxID=419590 RepID=UPI0031F92B0E
MTALDRTPTAGRALRPWQDPALAVADRVDALLTELTLEEKIGQLGSRWIGNDMLEPDQDPAPVQGSEPETLNVAPMQDVFAASGTVPLDEAVRDGLGHLTRVHGSAPLTAAQGAAEVVRLQRAVVEASRLGIPAIVHEECLTGFTAYGATVYPAAIAWAATFDPGLVRRMAAAIGRDMRAVGVHQGLSPVLDVVRDYRWGRVEETMGEDPYLVSTLGAAYVGGLESAGIIATLKHFAGYSASRAARNHGPVPMGRRELMDMILPPFEAAIALGGARSVMNSYSDVDGVPAGADPWLLTEVLREEWGFTGTVVSDYWAVPFLATMHHVAADPAEAGVQALTAGIDVELPDTLGFGRHLADRVRRGELPEALIDRAVRRLLTQKVELGLLDPDWTPEDSVAGAADVDLDSPGNRALARELAERSIILLDAGTALPLLGEGRAAPRRVAVVGPAAHDPRTFMGCYAFPNHVLPRHTGLGLGFDAPTVLDALARELPGAELRYERGCDVRGDDRSGFAAALDAAREADVCVTVVGDLAGQFGGGTSGEGCDATSL